eukprot:jgi/Bigna1/79507/fgenesh1_pg.63_\
MGMGVINWRLQRDICCEKICRLLKPTTPPYHAMFWISSTLCMYMGISWMLIGHNGEHSIDWVEAGISTFAARAPRKAWITAAILMFASSLVFLGLVLSFTGPLRGRISSHVSCMLLGSAAVGLYLVAMYEEIDNPQSHADVRQQAFHDAGVMIFISCSLLTLLCIGTSCLVHPPSHHGPITGRVAGLVMIADVPFVKGLMERNWTGRILKLEGHCMGLRQRSSFAALGVGLFLVAMLLRPVWYARASDKVKRR